MRFFALAAMLLMGCAMQHPSLFSLKYAVDDAPKEGKIYVKYNNSLNKDVCIDPANWPSAHGEIDSGMDRVFIEVSGHRYTTEDFDTGYCPGCFSRVRSGSSLVGFFKYSDFGLPIEDYSKEKVLTFSPMATYCRSKLRK